MKKHVLPALALSVLLLLGQILAFPAPLRAEETTDPPKTEDQTPTPAPTIADPGELYFGITSPVQLSVHNGNGASVTWEMKKPDSGTNQLSVTADGKLTIPAAGNTVITETITATLAGTDGAEATVLSLPLTVKKRLPSGLTADTVLEFKQGDTPALKDQKITVTVDNTKLEVTGTLDKIDTSKATEDGNAVLTPASISKPDEYSFSGVPITVKYKVTAPPPERMVTGLTIATQPKLEYIVGQPLDLSGLAVKIAYSDKTDAVVRYSDFSEYSLAVSEENGKILNDSYNGRTISITYNPSISVNTAPIKVASAEKTVTNITVKENPQTLTYTVGDELDLSGMVVTVKYSDNSAEDVTADKFSEKGITTAPAAKEKLTTEHNQSILVTHTASGKSCVTKPLVVSDKKIESKLTLITDPQSQADGGADVTLTLAFDRKGSSKPFPEAKEIAITSDPAAREKKALSGPNENGVYSAVYTLPDKNGTVKFTAAFQGNDSFEAAEASVQLRVETKKPIPVLSVSPDAAKKAGGGNVTLTVKMSLPTGAKYPAGSSIILSNDRGWKTVASGKDGTYTAKCTLPNKADTVTFTASFQGNSDLGQAEDALCTVETTLVLSDGRDAEHAIQALPSASEAAKLSAAEKKTALDQTRRLIEGISKLNAREKEQISDGSIRHLDELTAVLSGAELRETFNSNYSSSSSSAIDASDIEISGATAAANPGSGDKLQLVMSQQKVSGREAFKITLKLRKGANTVKLAVPVVVRIQLPRNFSYQDEYILRHDSKRMDDFSIYGGSGDYTLEFRTDSFSTFTLIRQTSSASSDDDDDWDDEDDDGLFDRYTITAAAGKGGSVSPSGDVRVNRGEDKTFTIRPNSGYEVDRVLIDGKREVKLTNGRYTFKEVNQPYTLEVTFRQTQAASSAPASSGSGTTSRPKPASSTANWPPASSSPPASSAPDSSAPQSSEPESSEPESSEPESSEPPSSLPDPSSQEETPPDRPASSQGLTDADLTVAVVIIVVVVALSLAAILFGIYLSRRQDDEDLTDDMDEDEDEDDDQ